MAAAPAKPAHAAIPETDTVRAFLEERHVAFAERVASDVARIASAHPEAEDDRSARELARTLLAELGKDTWRELLNRYLGGS